EPPLARAVPAPVALVAGDRCVRWLPWGKAARRLPGGRGAVPRAWAGLAELVERGDGASEAARALVAAQGAALVAAGVAAVALGCARAAAVAPLVVDAADGRLEVLDAAALAAARVRRTLFHAGLLARRKRPARRSLRTTHPARAAALAAAVSGRRRAT